MRNIFTVLLFMLLMRVAYSQEPTFANVAYVNDNLEAHLLDVYIPEGAQESNRTVMFIHGGGWSSGSKELTPGYCKELLDAGITIVGVNYRHSQDTLFPAQIHDVKTAVRFLKTHAEDYHIDTCNLGVMGVSAGGHLAALLGTSFNNDELEGAHLGSNDASSVVQAVVDFFGPTYFLEMDGFFPESCNEPLVHDIHNSSESKLLGCTISECPERVDFANPLAYINGDEPPFAIYHGDADCAVPMHQSEILRDQLVKFGIKVEYTEHPGGGHDNFLDPELKRGVAEYFKKALNNDCNDYETPTYPNPIFTGVEDEASLHYSVFPNPASSFFTVKGDFLDEVEVVDLMGKVVVRQAVKTGAQINIAGWSEGLYMIFLYHKNEKRYSFRLMKK
ncbi:alpha/beta hydrolase fold domain-containing protein [Fulvivirga sediminis]|uniref:Alpha/beta hydrolase fold domain-containing protein n=1 Tax=Fulvivirga sediminis TaxID=2803949 RepID=A0A937F506_9BACT|nr:alpha/beta hydrolase fold domain-containing protein [Fulvivirga sediminis]MBL3656496.1 alpha/beta hydrolase fold domain-containing protein [Fulvivirga sediminis]